MTGAIIKGYPDYFIPIVKVGVEAGIVDNIAFTQRKLIPLFPLSSPAY
ncbi:hypothetical protein ERJ70_14775 [Sediminibacillus dalangtanensis]|uniref:Uncharacterized protein n=1 Tax=Sediminibacillus dalangtanensis TaxID=2729421 RepID=A0ABX7VXH1_9BACI|nr:hypothetical protein [Sediminibacillus dalangtanensis]QTN00451.1 hypothetical protein ERJ70_14775 [Sediminibacillus dalangtanensis]